MHVILVNGSPHRDGCTATALAEVARMLEADGISTETIWLGVKPIMPCLACGKCYATKRCCNDDVVNEFLAKAETADGFVFGSPVHYAAASGQITTFLDRACFGKKKIFQGKPAAAVVSCRRGGAASAFDQLNKYFTINCMPVVSSQYWNMIHGSNAEEAARDEEGMQTMRTLGRNMSWLLRCIELGKQNGVPFPQQEKVIFTNFMDGK
ncbi:MAG: flavodoxin family protein [Akkermansia sp.]|nr:flavodoxin family protein [Akkermansia sp.]